MKNRIPVDFICIFIIFAIYATIVHFLSHQLQVYQWVGIIVNAALGNRARDVLYRDFEDACLFTFGVSLFATLSWYVIGQWGPRNYRASSGAWQLIWFGLLAVILMSATYSNYHWLVENHKTHLLIGEYNWELCALMSFGAGAFFYWLSTVLFSPVGIKFTPPLSSIFRRGW